VSQRNVDFNYTVKLKSLFLKKFDDLQFSITFFEKNLRNWRAMLGESQNIFAERFPSLNDSTAKRAVISSYELGNAKPSLDFLFEFSAQCGHGLDAIFSTEIDFGQPQMLREPPQASYEKVEPRNELSELKEKLEMLWNTNLHRAEKMEEWEMRLKRIEKALGVGDGK